jgi:MFS family permease
MFALQLAPHLARRGIHYGWLMVAITFLVSLASAGALGILGVLILPLQQETGWETATISGPLGLRLLLFGLMAPFAAALMQRYGLVRVVTLAMTLSAMGIGLSLFMTQVWQLWLTWGVMTGIGTGMTVLVLGATVANRWFVARRGLVVGLLTSAGASGQIIFLPLAAWMARDLGWREALVPGLAVCLIAGLLMLLLGTSHPSDLNLPAYGETRVTPPPPPPATNPARTAIIGLAEGSSSFAFWVLFGTFLVCGLSTAGLVQTHFVPLCADFGMGSVEAAGVLAMMGAFNFVGTVFSGWLSDRYDCRKLLFWYYGLRGLSLLWLPMSDFSLYGLSLFAIFYGLDWIATVPPTVKLAAQHFGREKGPLMFGWMFTGHQIGSAIAAIAGGMSRDALGSYLPAFNAAGVACLLAAVAVLALKRQNPPPVRVAVA